MGHNKNISNIINMYRNKGYLDSILKVEPERKKPVPRGKKGKKKKKKKPIRTEIQKLKDRYGKDFILQLLLMIMKGKTPGETRKKKEKKPKKMKRAGFGKGRSAVGFQTPSALKKERELAKKAAVLAAARQKKPGETDDDVKERVLRTTIAQSDDPTIGLIYELTGGFNLRKSNYDGLDLKGSIAYMGVLSRELQKIEKLEQEGKMTPEIALQRRGLETEAVKEIRKYRGPSFDKVYNPQGRGRRTAAITSGLKAGQDFALKLQQQIVDENDAGLIQQIIDSGTYGELLGRDPAETQDKPSEGPGLQELPEFLTRPDSPRKEKPKKQEPVSILAGQGRVGPSKAKQEGRQYTELQRGERRFGVSPTTQEKEQIPFIQRVRLGMLTKKEFQEELDRNQKVSYMLQVIGDLPANINPNDARLKGWGRPFTSEVIYEEYLKKRPDVKRQELKPVIPSEFRLKWKEDRYRINKLFGRNWSKNIQEYLAKLLSFGFQDIDAIPEEYLQGFFSPLDISKGVKRSEKILSPSELLDLAKIEDIKTDVGSQREAVSRGKEVVGGLGKELFDVAFERFSRRRPDPPSEEQPPPITPRPPPPSGDEGDDDEDDPQPPGAGGAVRRGPKKKDKEKDIQDKTQEYTQKVSDLDFSGLSASLDPTAEKQEILDRLLSDIQQDTTASQRNKLDRKLQGLVRRLEKGKTNIGFGLTAEKTLADKRNPTFSVKTKLQRTRDPDTDEIIKYSYTNTETGEVFNLFDLYPEAKELQTIIAKGGKGSKKLVKKLNQLDKDFKWSLNDLVRGTDLEGKDGFTNNDDISTIQEAEQTFGKKIPSSFTEATNPFRIRGSVVGAGEKGITIRNEKGYLRFIPFGEEEVVASPEPEVEVGLQEEEEQPPPIQPQSGTETEEQTAAGTDTTFVPDLEPSDKITTLFSDAASDSPGFISDQPGYERPAWLDKYAFSSTTSEGSDNWLSTEEARDSGLENAAVDRQQRRQEIIDRRAEEKRVASERQQQIRKRAEEKRARREQLQKQEKARQEVVAKAVREQGITEKQAQQSLQQFGQVLKKELLSSGSEGERTAKLLTEEKVKGPTAKIDTTERDEVSKKIIAQEAKIKQKGKKATKKEKSDLEVLKRRRTAIEKRILKQQQQIAELEKQAAEAPAFRIEDTYGIFTETDDSGKETRVRRQPIRNEEELNARIIRKQQKGDFIPTAAEEKQGITEQRKIDEYKSNFFFEVVGNQLLPNQRRIAAGRKPLAGPILTEAQQIKKDLEEARRLERAEQRRIELFGDEGQLTTGKDVEIRIDELVGGGGRGKKADARKRRYADKSLTPEIRITQNISDIGPPLERELATKEYQRIRKVVLEKRIKTEEGKSRTAVGADYDKYPITPEEEIIIQKFIDSKTKEYRDEIAAEKKREKERVKGLSPQEAEYERRKKEIQSEATGFGKAGQYQVIRDRLRALDIEFGKAEAIEIDEPETKPPPATTAAPKRRRKFAFKLGGRTITTTTPVLTPEESKRKRLKEKIARANTEFQQINTGFTEAAGAFSDSEDEAQATAVYQQEYDKLAKRFKGTDVILPTPYSDETFQLPQTEDPTGTGAEAIAEQAGIDDYDLEEDTGDYD